MTELSSAQLSSAQLGQLFALVWSLEGYLELLAPLVVGRRASAALVDHEGGCIGRDRVGERKDIQVVIT